MEKLKLLAEMLRGPALAMEGLDASPEEAASQVAERFPGKPYCVVQDWVLFDLEMPDLVRDGMAGMGQKPMMLVFLDMVHDALGRYPNGGWARTAPLQSFVEERFFETKDSVYVLLGPGQRRRATLSSIIRLPTGMDLIQ
ncbi:hypothetical protein Q069_00066 [Pseudomonas aeruginosa BL15]|uniref:DUF6957 family protein n=1 Tax=Pseudomonas aeruginosa TaxID=287 RepID=UPI0003B96534|nr:hypothetical protein [Pseudomonas aeruginosa]ERV37567.1 hypothetical protein Q069_00066 [Pseudomonas aeruginosa BL15]